MAALESRIDDLGALVSDIESTAGHAMLESASDMPLETLYSHYEAFFTARTIDDLAIAYGALTAAAAP